MDIPHPDLTRRRRRRALPALADRRGSATTAGLAAPVDPMATLREE